MAANPNHANIIKADEAIDKLMATPGIKFINLSRKAGLSIDSKGEITHFPIFIDCSFDKCLTLQEITEIKAKYSKLLSQYGECEIESQAITSGDKYIPIKVSKLESDDSFDLIHKPGEIWAIDIWATWCPSCQIVMAHNQEMLDHHPEWKGKVKIFGVSIDDEKEAVIQRINEKKWLSVEHYFANEGWDSHVVKSYGIHGIPYIALVNSDGLLVKFGAPNSLDLENSINRMLKGENLITAKTETKNTSSNDGEDTKLPFDDAIKILSSSVKKYKDATDKHNIMFRVIYTYNKLTNQVKSKISATNSFPIGKKNGDEAKSVVQLISNETKEIGNIICSLNVITTEVERGTKCCKCSKSINEDESQFKCRECSYTLCYKCITNDEHEHIMYFIRKGAQLDVLHAPGKDKTDKGNDSKIHTNIKCDCCNGIVSGIRWKCAFCKDADICNSCFLATLNGKNEDNVDEYEGALEAHHDIDHHVLMRIVRNGSFKA